MRPRTVETFEVAGRELDGVYPTVCGSDVWDAAHEQWKKKRLLCMVQELGEKIALVGMYACRSRHEKLIHNIA